MTDHRPTAAIVIPALNEESAIGGFITEIVGVALQADLPVRVTSIIVVDNGSEDQTAARAAAAGAAVVPEPRRGYGRACLSGVIAADAEIIVLMDGDGSDQPAELPGLVNPLIAGEADLVIGSRTLGSAAPGSLLPQQRFGNWLATRLLRLLYGERATDIGPFRAIHRDDLLRLEMREMTYGWSIEMMARAARQGLRLREVPVCYRNRASGDSKVSGNFRASVRAGARIIATLLRCRWDTKQPVDTSTS
jgi:glycosyltransferase involved in cell wall biosynthesis